MKNNKEKVIRIVWWVLFISYLTGISYFLFFSERYGRTEGSQEYRYNLILFREIKRFINYHDIIGTKGLVINLLGNVIAFMPFGFCLPLISRQDGKLFKIVLWSFGFSFAIETIQLLYRIGIFDVDDLLLNTIGGVLGFFVYCCVIRVGKWRR